MKRAAKIEAPMVQEKNGLIFDFERAFELTDILGISAVPILQALAVREIKEISKEDVKDLENKMKMRYLPMISNSVLNNDPAGLYFSKSA